MATTFREVDFSPDNYRFKTRYLAWTLLGLFTLIFIISLPFLQKVFAGDILLNQTIYRVRLDYINLLGLDVPIRDITVRFYSVLFLLGVLSGFSLSIFLFARSYLPNTLADRLFIGLILFGLIGARVGYVIFNWDYYSQSLATLFSIGSFSLQIPDKVFLIYEGGLSLFGGLAGAFGYLYFYARRYHFNLFEILDILAPSLLLGQIIGRLGNFFNYEAYGGPTALWWKMYVPEAAINTNKYVYDNNLAQYFHPTFLYEMIPNVLILFGLLYYYEALTKKHSGLVLSLYLIGYGSVRAITELFRLDALKIPFHIDINTPGFLVSFVSNFAPVSIREPLSYGLAHLHFEAILVSQVVAIIFVIVGVRMYRQRVKIIYSHEKLVEMNS